MFIHLWHGLCDLVFPRNCVLCRTYLDHPQTRGPLCPSCAQRVVRNAPPFCRQCSRHLPENETGTLCSLCRHHRYHFDRGWAVTQYNDTMKQLIHAFKYGQKTSLRHFFSHLMSSFVREHASAFKDMDLIVPIPLHPARLRERGYNQSRLLIEGLTRSFPLPFSSDNLIRVRHTPHQANLKDKERWTNIKGAFKIRNSREIEGKNVLIVDDLLTTGATISEAALSLKEAGARKVHALTVAITM